MDITFDDKDKSIVDGVHNYLRDVDANEIKRSVNSKLDANKLGVPNGAAPLGNNGKIPSQYITETAQADEIPITPSGDLQATNVADAIAELEAEKQPRLGFNPESTGNKATNLSDNTSNTKYPTVKATVDGDNATLEAAKAYSDAVNTNVLGFRGYFDPTGATIYPTTGGTGTAGAILPGNTWEISVAIAENPGVHPAYDIGDLIIAKIATPGQTAANWGRSAQNTTQATELMRGTAMLATQGEIQDEASSNDIDMITPKKFWFGIVRFIAIAWTFAQKITFTTAPRFSSVAINNYLKVDVNRDLVGLASIPGADVSSATDTGKGAVELATPTEVQTGTDSTRAATAAGVAARINRLPAFEFSSDVISNNNLTLSGVGQIVQGLTLVAGMVIIANGQTTISQKGIYIVDAGAWLRIGGGYNNDVYNYAGNFEGSRIFNKTDKKNYQQISTVAEIATIGQKWIDSLSVEIIDSGSPSFTTISTIPSIITLDFLSLKERMFFGSTNITTDKSWLFDNINNAVMLKSLRFNSAAGVNHLFPSNVKMNDTAFRGHTWTPFDGGEFEIVGTRDPNDIWIFRAFGPY